MIPIITLDSTITLDKVFSLPTTTITHDWNEDELPFAVRFVIAKHPSTLYFGAEVETAPIYDKRKTRGTYVEGLWEMDVAELFLANKSGCYLEFNLSPCGAWWNHSFSAPRTRDTSGFKAPSKLTCYSKIEPRAWRTALSVPIEELSLKGCFEEGAKANVCFIAGKPRRFISWSHLGSGEPDFHRPENFEAIEFAPGL
jgi:hypothetical protein